MFHSIFGPQWAKFKIERELIKGRIDKVHLSMDEVVIALLYMAHSMHSCGIVPVEVGLLARTTILAVRWNSLRQASQGCLASCNNVQGMFLRDHRTDYRR